MPELERPVGADDEAEEDDADEIERECVEFAFEPSVMVCFEEDIDVDDFKGTEEEADAGDGVVSEEGAAPEVRKFLVDSAELVAGAGDVWSVPNLAALFLRSSSASREAELSFCEEDEAVGAADELSPALSPLCWVLGGAGRLPRTYSQRKQLPKQFLGVRYPDQGTPDREVGRYRKKHFKRLVEPWKRINQ